MPPRRAFRPRRARRAAKPRYRRKMFRPRRPTRALGVYSGMRFRPFPFKSSSQSRGYYKIRYATAVSLNGGGGADISKEYLFRLNGCFDPDLSGTGHQPYGFDQLAAMWSRYNVIKTKVTVLFHIDGATGGNTLYMRSGDTLTGSTLIASDQIREGRLADTYREAPPVATYVGQLRQLKLQKTYIMSKMKTVANSSSYSAVFTADPTDSIFVAIGQCVNSAPNSLAVTAHVTMEFSIVTTGPKDSGAS